MIKPHCHNPKSSQYNLGKNKCYFVIVVYVVLFSFYADVIIIQIII